MILFKLSDFLKM